MVIAMPAKNAFSRLLSLPSDAVLRFMRARRRRKQVLSMAHWSDAQLADIGVRRSDINRALTLPFGDDPTDRLAEWRSEANEARRAQYREARETLREIEARRVRRSVAVAGRLAEG